jgi:peptide/nickel transport system substrate-binding protein
MDRPLFFDYTVNKLVPNLAAGYEVSDDGKVTTLFLREGLKWSDGQPLTADDFMFWYEKIYKNKDLTKAGTPLLQSGGKEGVIEKVDDYTIAFKFEAPYFIFPEVLAGFNVLTSPGTFGFQGGGGVAPAHYLEQFHPDFTPLAEVQALAKAAGYDDWTILFMAKNSWELNPDLPVLAAWKTTTPANTPLWTIERNPYFWAVDSAGNQLPYIDKMTFSIAENLEVLNLRAISGEYSFQDRHVDLQKLPLYLENQQRGQYKVYLDPSDNGSNAQWRWNMSYEEDEEIAKWINNKDFRHAVSIGIDRDQINETFFLGLGTPGSPIPAPTNPFYPGDEYRTLWHTTDVAKANELLDSIGLTIEVEAISGQFVPYDKVAEMIKDQLKEIGIDIKPLVVERSLANERHLNNQHQVHLWDNGNADRMFSGGNNLFPNDGGNSMGPLYAQWFFTNGAEGKEPPAEMKTWMETWRKALASPEAERVETGKKLWVDYVEETWVIGLVGLSPATGGVRIVKSNMGNIPGRIVIGTDSWNPMSSRLETWYFKP